MNRETESDFFAVDRDTERKLAEFFFDQRKRTLANLKKLKSRKSRAKDFLVAQSDYDALCLFELCLGLQHEVQANNMVERFRKNHSLTLQKIFRSKQPKLVKLQKSLVQIFERETKAKTFFRSPPRLLVEFYEKLVSQQAV